MAKFLGIDTDALKRAGTATAFVLALGNGEYNAGERRFLEGDNWWKAQGAGLTVDNVEDGIGMMIAIGNGIVDGANWLKGLGSDENPQGTPATTLPEASAATVATSPDRASAAVLYFTLER